VGAVAAATALVVVAATDAGGPWSLRLGMTAALLPLCGALGTLAAVQVAAARGELRALAAIGSAPWRAVAGAALGGIAVGLVGPLLAGSGLADLAALFPREAAARSWIADDGGLLETTLGLRVAADGGLSLEAPRSVAAGLPAGALGASLVALAVSALAVPVWVAAGGGSRGRHAAVGGVAVGAAIVAFQGVAAGRLPAWALVTAPAALAVDGVLGLLSARS
jgi:hypothetical protein